MTHQKIIYIYFFTRAYLVFKLLQTSTLQNILGLLRFICDKISGMIKTILTDEATGEPLWIDVTDPKNEELLELAKKYNLHSTFVQDCMQPFHLPKHEKIGNTTFIIVRSYENNSSGRTNSVQSMTRKIALFLGERFLISVHRREQPFLEPIIAKYNAKSPIFLQKILLEILLGAIETFHLPIENAEEQVHKYETNIFTSQNTPKKWQRVFLIKTRVMIIKRMLWHTLNSVQKFIPNTDTHAYLTQDLKERIENLLFFADSLEDNLNDLLNVQISLASNTTNEVMRILTLFSVVFMPLNFVVGVYGMNFTEMPLLHEQYGFWIVMTAIVAMLLLTYLWFKNRGWLRK